MNRTATTNWGYQATVGAAARDGRRHHAAALKPMPSTFVVPSTNGNGIGHRPPEDST